MMIEEIRYTPEELKAAEIVREVLDKVREKYKGFLRDHYKENLNKNEFSCAALFEIISRMSTDDVVAKYNDKVLKLCKISIQADIGSLTDIPHELSNTIANYYYKFHSLFLDLETNPIPTMAKQEKIFRGLEYFLSEAQMMLSLIKCLPDLVNGLRKFDRKKESHEFNLLLELILDVYKYDIKDATTKTGLRRMIERKFKTVNEIPNLVDLL